MLRVIDWRAIAGAIAEASGEAFDPGPPQSVGGGCINQALRLVDGERSWFVKVNGPGKLDMFEAEQAALEALHGTATLRVPRPLCTGSTAGHSFIVMEHIPFGTAGAGGHRQGGEQLAALHRHTATRFGWDRDNTIGATPQPNAWREAWADFWRENRLGFQLRLAARNGHGGRLQQLGERLLEGFPVLLDHAPAPSLLHGDLWGGNFGFDASGQPVIFDPATYYGDREADLAMTELFGGFPREFHAAYVAAWPLDAGYRVRKTFYNLYHVLNHLNLFGGGYAGQAESMISRLLAEL